MNRIIIDITNVYEDDKNILLERIHEMNLSCFKRDKKEHHLLKTYYDVKISDVDVTRRFTDYLSDECWSWKLETIGEPVKTECR